VQISINTADPRPIYVQIMDEVRRAIVMGSLRPEDPLPSVRQLSSDLRVNPNTVAQAYRDLERAGTVYVRRGQGTFVAQTGAGQAERRAMVRGVAERALVEAHRSGVSAEELIEAIREAAASRELPTLAGQS
jgi:GntR family transcriptional regulator